MANVASFSDLFAGSFTVGTPEKPAGITLYDQATGAPYCIQVVNGQTETIPGECSKTTNGQNTTATTTPAISNAPVITISGNNPASVEKGSPYNDLGASITNVEDQNLGIKAIVDGVDVGDLSKISINTASTSIHTIEYYAIDQEGNRGSAVRTVNVYDSYATSTSTPPVTSDTEASSTPPISTDDTATTSPEVSMNIP